MTNIERARLLATFVHLGQKRQDGENYINHPQRLVEEYKNIICGGKEFREVAPPLTSEQEDIICTIWLHDTLEDTSCRLGVHHLIADYFSAKTMWLVALLTHEKHETYNQYIEKIIQSPEALQIKFLDMIDNCSYSIPPKQELKYKNACVFLKHLEIKIPKILEDKFKYEL